MSAQLVSPGDGLEKKNCTSYYFLIIWMISWALNPTVNPECLTLMTRESREDVDTALVAPVSVVNTIITQDDQSTSSGPHGLCIFRRNTNRILVAVRHSP